LNESAQRSRRQYSAADPFIVHIENARSFMPVFIVHPEQYEAALKRHPDLARIVKTTMAYDGEKFEESIRQADAMVSSKFPRDKLRQHAPRLKWIQVLGAGVDNLLPLDWMPQGLQLTTNSGAHVPKAAESAMMAILMANARIPTLATSQREHKWNRLFTTTVQGKTLLIVGVGHIGGGAAESARKLGMKVLGIRRSKQAHPAVDEMHGPEQMLSLLGRADIVLVNTALVPDTKLLMGEQQFAAMKPGAGFINMARGELVDQKALEQALRSGKLSCAVIDVTSPEPLPEDSPLYDTPNLLITPHVLSDDIDQYVPRTLDIFFDNIRRHIAGQPMRNVVNVERGY
jgi:phosphoglycerate dehydrogenase-like enzyme